MSQLNVILFGVIGVLLLDTACHADSSDENVSIEHIFNMAQNVLNATTGWQKDIMEYSGDGRKSKFLPLGGGLLPFHALCKYFCQPNCPVRHIRQTMQSDKFAV